ncbi:esterase-like activity of phytase family protein [Actinomadura rudentiformis]|uniref:Esterase-like activity of phytase family protein n=1 Tax=Actinomadura rudentiformis TaxID=359158 RepID=A0A6H9YMG3_9ACTN|nr:esterase-like activity of phytase family protein [Actinomadura rudentiformis]KAB2347020.1 esterase-like activity of phytase family protein [Actinomadura rudentiformis]
MRSSKLLTPVAALATLAALASPACATAKPAATCSPAASLLGFSDALDKTELNGTAVAGLSALALSGDKRAVALVDNIGTTPARFYDLSLRLDRGVPKPAARKVTTLTRPDGTPYTGADFDGEGLVVERGGQTILASSETEPSIRRFRRSDGRQTAELPVPERFRVAPAGQATRNQTFESLAATPDGRTLYAGMEGPLSTEAFQRIIRYEGRAGGRYTPAAQYAYQTDPTLSLVELIALRHGGLLAMERGFTPGVGNTVRIYRTSAKGARDVTNVPSPAPGVVLRKELVVDIATCPPSGATAKQPQPNPLLDNIEGMALDGRVLYLISDDNGSATQITRVYALAIRASRGA